ncbi:hypothetical protein Emin_0257 [Elusimicrobium minutum Pei191]|uniref:Uncharacterized protein n=1 Tax=Elusimicrobium minutum (strain Pei191) TaxID=445932 RepID=B2KB60_ELUMP|nr:hypothetical protein [Elusimicrobium minutum]ACC97819.1 hypothetical protein Emin_0257 [Elusimicrobium minutum Pei191]
MKNFFTFIVLTALVFCAYTFYNKSEESKFTISGTVEVPQRLLKHAQAKNNTASIIIKNEADVPIAIKRIINPTFPLQFKVDTKDLLVGEVDGKVKIDVQINNHGNLGILKAGDIFGAAEGTYAMNSKNIIISADKMTGTPKMVNTRGNFFRTAAR